MQVNNKLHYHQHFIPIEPSGIPGPEVLRRALHDLSFPFRHGESIGIKIHWGERGNHNFLSAAYTRMICDWLREGGVKPFVCDTTVLYSGGRRTGEEALKTAAEHGFTEASLGCPIIIADGVNGREVIDIPCGYRHFKTVQVAAILDQADGFVVFSHFKGHLATLFGGAIKNLSMGFASRAQKQCMHADARPILKTNRCTRCGVCVEICPAGAANIAPPDFPTYNRQQCIGCAQCIALCPEAALKILWDMDAGIFQERVVETAAAVWNHIGERTMLINALLNITADCDCMPVKQLPLLADQGFCFGVHPIAVDEESLQRVEARRFLEIHGPIPWERQFSFARAIGFVPADTVQTG